MCFIVGNSALVSEIALFYVKLLKQSDQFNCLQFNGFKMETYSFTGKYLENDSLRMHLHWNAWLWQPFPCSMK